MRTLAQTFTDSWPVAIGGRYLRIISATVSIDVLFFRGGMVVADAYDVGPGYYAMPAEAFDRFEIKAIGAATVKVAVSDGSGGYDLVAVVGSITATLDLADTITDTAPVTVGTAATALVAASATRRAVRFYNAGTADVYLGGSGVTTANGCIKIAAGQSWFEDDAPGAAWYGISGTAGQSVRIQEVA